MPKCRNTKAEDARKNHRNKAALPNKAAPKKKEAHLICRGAAEVEATAGAGAGAFDVVGEITWTGDCAGVRDDDGGEDDDDGGGVRDDGGGEDDDDGGGVRDDGGGEDDDDGGSVIGV
ncbi:hypothetical protein SUGI_0988560 [Cryptomeria japonica]|nr:hypothetical protein SUGI_0988560 [Cryptomeria japonica]